MDPQADEQPAADTVRFRPGKKRKAYRQRSEEDAEPSQFQAESAAAVEQPAPVTAAEATPTPDQDSDDKEEDEGAALAALRLRNARRARFRGVGFRSDARPDEQQLVLADHHHDPSAEREPIVTGIADRFTHQTGLIGALNDKHMTQYIEARLSKRSAQEGTSIAHNHSNGSTSLSSAATNDASIPHDQSVLRGKLMEVDIAQVAAPARRGPAAPDTLEGSRKKPRLGKDGKPWRSRNRRGSDDIKRDQLVEAFLHENRRMWRAPFLPRMLLCWLLTLLVVDVYDVPKPSESVLSPGEEADGAADERLAEQFKKQYLDDIAQRKQRKKPPQPVRQVNEDVLKGPKLGGSRNSRAAMRDLLLKKEKETKR
ncbi:hypothetical protein S40293_05627 [Stachybotrys chartarum IBT 40293]|nr:hypothetical protein S40293_05627 [Stachybotrys chartarum IBT 40293]